MLRVRTARFSWYSEVSISSIFRDLRTSPNNLIKRIGTGLSLYGRTGPGGGILNLVFDGKRDPLYLNSTISSTDSIRLWHTEGLPDGDHQVICWTTALDGNDVYGVANVWIDYFA